MSWSLAYIQRIYRREEWFVCLPVRLTASAIVFMNWPKEWTPTGGHLYQTSVLELLTTATSSGESGFIMHMAGGLLDRKVLKIFTGVIPLCTKFFTTDCCIGSSLRFPYDVFSPFAASFLSYLKVSESFRAVPNHLEFFCGKNRSKKKTKY